MKRCFVLIFILCLLFPLLTACGGGSEEILLSPLDEAELPPLSRSERSVRIATPFGPAVTAALPSPAPTLTPRSAPGAAEPQHYVLNTGSKRFHLPDCSSVGDMKKENREDFTGSRDELIARGFKPCGRCHP